MIVAAVVAGQNLVPLTAAVLILGTAEVGLLTTACIRRPSPYPSPDQAKW